MSDLSSHTYHWQQVVLTTHLHYFERILLFHLYWYHDEQEEGGIHLISLSNSIDKNKVIRLHDQWKKNPRLSAGTAVYKVKGRKFVQPGSENKSVVFLCAHDRIILAREQLCNLRFSPYHAVLNASDTNTPAKFRMHLPRKRLQKAAIIPLIPEIHFRLRAIKKP